MSTRETDRRNPRRAAIRGVVGVWVCVLSFELSDRVRAQDLDPAKLPARIARLQQSVEQLAGSDDLLDTLHFGWFDRPYPRARLAVLVKTTAVLRREARLRERGNGAIPDETVQTMLAWADQALERVVASRPDPTLRPHRLRVTAADFAVSGQRFLAGETGGPLLPPLFGFVDRATSTRHNERLGDLDLLAAMGLRVYSRPAQEVWARRPTLGPGEEDPLPRRAGALGMALLELGSSGSPAMNVNSMTLRAFLESTPGTRGASGAAVALSDPAGGESWPASLARRALLRGTMGGSPRITANWRTPQDRDATTTPPDATAAAMWVHAIQGQSLGLLRGWRDLRDGSGSPHASLLVHPARVETITHTALDLMRFAGHLADFGTAPPLLIVVDGSAVDEDHDDRWAAWIEPLWATLLERQITFDVVGLDAAESDLRGPYEVVLPVRRADAAQASTLVARVEQTLLGRGSLRSRVTAREPPGRLARDLFVRTAAAPSGPTCIAVVNLSGRDRLISLHSQVEWAMPTLLVDLITHERIDEPGRSVTLGPWQVRLLTTAR